MGPISTLQMSITKANGMLTSAADGVGCILKTAAFMKENGTMMKGMDKGC